MYKKRNFSRRRKVRRFRSFDPTNLIKKIGNTSNQQEEPLFEEPEGSHSFEGFDLEDSLHQAIVERKFTKPTPIQDQSIPQILDGKDLVGISNTGTGKTGAFLIPLVNKVLKNPNSRVLVIAPTRELALQINEELSLFTKKMKINSVACIGGVNIRVQIYRLKSNPQFIVATPGRLIDLTEQSIIDLRTFDSVVLDEVDRMLDMGFINYIKKIIAQLPSKKYRQSLFFSATTDVRTHSVMDEFLNEPTFIAVKTRETNAKIEQKIVNVNGRNKNDILIDLLDKKEVQKVLVFVRTKRSADVLSKHLYSIGFKTAVMHGNKSQNQRQRSLQQFKEGQVNTLIATDVASRGIDVDDITHVINYDLPETKEDYVHRIGRTGRSGKSGVALSFV